MFGFLLWIMLLWADVCVGCPGPVCILVSILLPREGLPLMRSRSHTQVISLNLLPILTGRMKAGADQWLDNGRERWDWRSQRQGGERETEDDEEVEGRWSETTWPGEAANNKGSHSWETNQYSDRTRHKLTNIITVVCFYMGLLGWEITTTDVQVLPKTLQ